MRGVAIQILVPSLVWLGVFTALGFGFAYALASHVSGIFIVLGLIFGAFGVAGEIGYVAVTVIFGRSRWPRWILVGLWSFVVPLTAYVVMEVVRQNTRIIEELVLLMMWCTVPVFATAYLASSLSRRLEGGEAAGAP